MGEKWFNIQTCGSWRLAFLLARLQRIIWDQGASLRTLGTPIKAVKPLETPVAAMLAAPPAATLPSAQTAASLRLQKLWERVRAKEAGSVVPASNVSKVASAASL